MPQWSSRKAATALEFLQGSTLSESMHLRSSNMGGSTSPGRACH
jgi:hypothetical protein